VNVTIVVSSQISLLLLLQLIQRGRTLTSRHPFSAGISASRDSRRTGRS
jgi:hypothetical protein